MYPSPLKVFLDPLIIPAVNPTPGNHKSASYHYKSVCIFYKWNYITCILLYNLYLFWEGDLASFILHKFCEMIQVISISDSFLFIAEQYSIMWTHYNLFIHLLMVIWIVFKFRLFQIRVLWTFIYKSLYGQEYLFSWKKHLWVEWLDHMLHF